MAKKLLSTFQVNNGFTPKLPYSKQNFIFFPVYKDVNTPSPFKEDLTNLGDDGEKGRAALPDHIYISMLWGSEWDVAVYN